MKPSFTIHEGEFLVGDHINRKLGRKFEVWVPTKDSGVDLLVTCKRRRRNPVALQVKFSRGFSIREVFAGKRELAKRIPRDCAKLWQLYLWVYGNRSCYDVRGLRNAERLDTLHSGVRNPDRDYSEWLENWKQLESHIKEVR